jgi:hypothetical protein
LSNKSLYEFSPEQLKKIFAAIRESIGEAEARFKGDPKGGAEFKL